MTHSDRMDLSLKDLTDFEAHKTSSPGTKVGTDDAVNLEQKWRLFEARLNYGWNFFDFHAKQRILMFNFFLLFVGFMLTAYGTLLKDGNFLVSAFLALVGVWLTFIFLFLERRNEELVHIAESVLESLEMDVLFKGYTREVHWPMRRDWWGRLSKGKTRAQLGIFLRQETDDKAIKPSKYRHGKWIPWFQVSVIVMFLVLLVVPLVLKARGNAAPVQQPSPIDVRIVK